MNGVIADLHSHTTCSDGILTPRELVAKAAFKGLKALAITDHDNMVAYRQLKQDGYDVDVRLIPGIELSCTTTGRDAHILGYFMDADSEELIRHEREFLDDRHRRAEVIVGKLNKIRVPVSIEDVLNHAGNAPVGRPHIASALVTRGFVRDIQQAFDIYLDNGGPAYAPRSPFSITEGISLIKRLGGVAIVAHPGKVYKDPQAFLALLAQGIDGVEAYHPSHWTITRDYYLTLAKQHDLLVSGGSDFHGTRSYDDSNFGTFGATQEMIDSIEQLSQSRS